MDREKIQLDKADQLQLKLNELTAQIARLIKQLYQLGKLQKDQVKER